MSIIENLIGVSRFVEPRVEGSHRSPGIVVLEFGGGGCNKAGAPSCRDFCAVPTGRDYDPQLDPTLYDLSNIFLQIRKLQPAALSLVPNGEAVDTIHDSNTKWGVVHELDDKGMLTKNHCKVLERFYVENYLSSNFESSRPMNPAEKMAVTIALASNCKLNVSLTTNGGFLNKNLIKLYSKMGLQSINLSYHPNRPYNPERKNVDLIHLINRADEAIENGIIPTITHVLTRQNADTFVALADRVTAHDVLFSVGIANARGGSFSTDNVSIEPTEVQVRTVFLRLLARKLFADRHIRTTIPYLMLAPYMRRWVCDQSTDFFHISFEDMQKNGLRPHLNVCSEVRPEMNITLDDFLIESNLDTKAYLNWRDRAMKNPDTGCPSCTHQCYFEAETRGLDVGDSIAFWDYWDTVGKALRQRHTFRNSIRPTVSKKIDFQNSYLWESLLQGVARKVASMAHDDYWQRSFQRGGVDFDSLVESLANNAFDTELVNALVQAEQKDNKIQSDWQDASSLQSRMLRAAYMPFQKSGRESGIAIPVKFSNLLKHESSENFLQKINKVKPSGSTSIDSLKGTIFPMIRGFGDLFGISPKVSA